MARCRAAIGACALLAALATARPSAATPCPPMKPPAELMRDGYQVFEGVVAEQWNQVIADQVSEGSRKWTIRVLRSYRFHVLRDWSAGGREVTLTHGWYEGSRYWRGDYPAYAMGERYLVFASFHDMPAHSFTSSCLPGAHGDDIAALAERLGPPRATYEMPPPARTPFWRQPVNRAREYAEALKALITIAIVER